MTADISAVDEAFRHVNSVLRVNSSALETFVCRDILRTCETQCTEDR